jgi:septal ring factor EnvC (AmiA/AmiB activator)
MTNQPEALQLADALEAYEPVQYDAAAELRRLHAENQKLRTALEQQTAGHDKTLDELRIAEQDKRELRTDLAESTRAIDWLQAINSRVASERDELLEALGKAVRTTYSDTLFSEWKALIVKIKGAPND